MAATAAAAYRAHRTICIACFSSTSSSSLYTPVRSGVFCRTNINTIMLIGLGCRPRAPKCTLPPLRWPAVANGICIDSSRCFAVTSRPNKPVYRPELAPGHCSSNCSLRLKIPSSRSNERSNERATQALIEFVIVIHAWFRGSNGRR